MHVMQYSSLLNSPTISDIFSDLVCAVSVKDRKDNKVQDSSSMSGVRVCGWHCWESFNSLYYVNMSYSNSIISYDFVQSVYQSFFI